MGSEDADADLECLKHYHLPPKFYEDGNFQTVRDMILRDDDIFVVTFPKAGTTWTQEMVWMITRNLDFESGKVPLDERSPTLEWPFSFSVVPSELRKGDLIEVLDKLESPRIIKTHLPWEALPTRIRSPQSKAKIIYVARNPKDVIVSMTSYGMKIGIVKTLETRSKEMLGTGPMMHAFGPYWDHVLRFWERRDQPNILFLKYEDMKKDLSKVVQQVVSFLGKSPLSQSDLDRLLTHLSFERMRNNPGTNRQEYMKKYKNFAGGDFIRKGEVGSWKKEMPEDMRQQFDEWIEKNTKGTGLSFEEEL